MKENWKVTSVQARSSPIELNCPLNSISFSLSLNSHSSPPPFLVHSHCSALHGEFWGYAETLSKRNPDVCQRGGAQHLSAQTSRSSVWSWQDHQTREAQERWVCLFVCCLLVWYDFSYSAPSPHNDIALLKLKGPINFGRWRNVADRICLAGSNVVPDEEKCRVAGWGLTKTGGKASDILRSVQLPIVACSKVQSILKWASPLLPNWAAIVTLRFSLL